jgi:hypothetical protein
MTPFVGGVGGSQATERESNSISWWHNGAWCLHPLTLAYTQGFISASWVINDPRLKYAPAIIE